MDKQYYISKNQFSIKKYERFIIAADIGGEHTYVAIIGIIEKKKYEIIFKYTYSTKEIHRIHEALNSCLEEAFHNYGIEISRAVVAAAGPVSRKRTYIKLTNIDFQVNTSEILNNTLLKKVILVNDFEAIGYGLDLLDINKDVVMLPHVGEDLTNRSLLSNTFAVIGAGNGLGVTIAYYDSQKHMHVPLPSEGGHVEFSPHDEIELELVRYLKERVLKKKDVHPEFERLVSGIGMSHIYDFLRYKKIFPETEITKKIDSMQGIPKLKEIDNSQNDPTCRKTSELFFSFYARAARNLALTAECYSGLFITGGIVSHYLDTIRNGEFMREFEMHDIRNDVLRKTPVYVILNKDVGLLGCCNVAVNFYNLI